MALFTRKQKSEIGNSRLHWQRSGVYELAVTGMLIGLNLACKVIFDFIPVIPPYISFSPVYFVVAISCYLLKRKTYAFALLLISPWLWFVSGHATSVNVADFVMEYWLPVLFLFPFAFVAGFEGSGTRPGWPAWLAAFAFLILAIAVVRLVLTTYAGVLWYRTSLVGSLIFNWPNMYVDVAITGFLFFATYLAFFRLRRAVR